MWWCCSLHLICYLLSKWNSWEMVELRRVWNHTKARRGNAVLLLSASDLLSAIQMKFMRMVEIWRVRNHKEARRGNRGHWQFRADACDLHHPVWINPFYWDPEELDHLNRKSPIQNGSLSHWVYTLMQDLDHLGEPHLIFLSTKTLIPIFFFYLFSTLFSCLTHIYMQVYKLWCERRILKF